MPTRQATIGQRTVSLDARPDRLDLRDRPYIPPLGNLPAQWPSDSKPSEVAGWPPPSSWARAPFLTCCTDVRTFGT